MKNLFFRKEASMTKKEYKEIQKFTKKVLKLCDDMDEVLDRMMYREENQLPVQVPKAPIDKRACF